MEENVLFCSMTIATDDIFAQSIPKPMRSEASINRDEADSTTQLTTISGGSGCVRDAHGRRSARLTVNGLPEILARAIAIATSSGRQLSWKVKENSEATLIKMEWKTEAIPSMNPSSDNVDSK